MMQVIAERPQPREREGGVSKHAWTVDEYARLGEAGFFEGRRVQLIAGEILDMSPMGEHHAVGVNKLHRLFVQKLPDTVFVRCQLPLYPNESSAPEPDIAIVDAQVALSLQRPTTALLAVEVSDATLLYDRTVKASLYASAQIPEYWVLDVQGRTLEVFRAPVQDESQPFGWRYGEARLLGEEAAVSALCAPDVSFAAREFLP
jgi:Uma2 family endonuclease